MLPVVPSKSSLQKGSIPDGRVSGSNELSDNCPTIGDATDIVNNLYEKRKVGKGRLCDDRTHSIDKYILYLYIMNTQVILLNLNIGVSIVWRE